ncbi:MAG: EamA family transporter [Clostridia bacterium]|nr:EamA family transporter [Clostridia bacterium]
MNRENRARIMMILSMLIFGSIGLFVKSIPLPSGEIALYRAAMASVLLGLFLLISGQKISLRTLGKEGVLLIISGAAMAFNWILLFEAYNYTTVSVATLSYYFAPVIVTIVCPILFREKMTAKSWICFAFSTLGLVLITGTGDLSKGSSHLKGILLGLGAACLYATVILLNKSIKKIGGIQRTFLQFVAAALVLIPYVLLTGGMSIMDVHAKGIIMLLIVGIVHTGITYCMYFTSIKELSGQKVAILSYIDPLFAVLASVLILTEPFTVYQAIGGLLILGFTLVNEIPRKSK